MQDNHSEKEMETLQTFVQDLDDKGDLHDCQIRQVSWRVPERSLQLEIADLNGNFYGLPEYPGAKPGRVSLSDVDSISFDVAMTAPNLHIFEVVAQKEGNCLLVEVRLVPSGVIKVRCGSARIDEAGPNL